LIRARSFPEVVPTLRERFKRPPEGSPGSRAPRITATPSAASRPRNAGDVERPVVSGVSECVLSIPVPATESISSKRPGPAIARPCCCVQARQEQPGRPDIRRAVSKSRKTGRGENGNCNVGVEKETFSPLDAADYPPSNPKPIWWPTSEAVSRKHLMTRGPAGQRRLVTSRRARPAPYLVGPRHCALCEGHGP